MADEPEKKVKPNYILLGVLIGVIFSAALRNIGIGICMGVVFALAMYLLNKRKED